MVGAIGKKVITGVNIREHFHETVSKAVVNQSIEISEYTIIYIVNLLATFLHSNELYENTPEGLKLKPLVYLYLEAATVSSDNDRNRVLKRLGDVALFIAGVFSESLTNRPAGVDYYIAMGGNAYGYLSEVCKGNDQKQVHGDIYDELSNKFTNFVDLLSEVSEQSNLGSHKELLRLYDFWIKTNSKRAERQLKKHGIFPIQSAAKHKTH